MRRVRQFGLLATLAAGSIVAAQEPSSRQVEWLYYGGDPGGTKHSALTDINAGNLQRLQVAWQWKHWETPPAPGFFESTPLMIDGVLYVTTPYNNVAAVDAETGKEKWRFEARPRSWVRCCQRVDGSCAGPRSGMTRDGCVSS